MPYTERLRHGTGDGVRVPQAHVEARTLQPPADMGEHRSRLVIPFAALGKGSDEVESPNIRPGVPVVTTVMAKRLS